MDRFGELKLIAFVAIGLATVTLAGCLIFGPMLHAEITSVWREIDEEIREFKFQVSNFLFLIFISKFQFQSSNFSPTKFGRKCKKFPMAPDSGARRPLTPKPAEDPGPDGSVPKEMVGFVPRGRIQEETEDRLAVEEMEEMEARMEVKELVEVPLAEEDLELRFAVSFKQVSNFNANPWVWIRCERFITCLCLKHAQKTTNALQDLRVRKGSTGQSATLVNPVNPDYQVQKETKLRPRWGSFKAAWLVLKAQRDLRDLRATMELRARKGLQDPVAPQV